MKPYRVSFDGMTGDEITLTIPRDPSFHEVAHLVLGGVAARLDLGSRASTTWRPLSTPCWNGRLPEAR